MEMSGTMDITPDWEVDFGNEAELTQMSAADALLRSLENKGRVDIRYIAMLSGLSPRDAVRELSSAVYLDPEQWKGDPYEGWQTSDEYLSGDLKHKWEAAERESRRCGGLFDRNLRAIEKVMPSVSREREIYVALGSPWLPCALVDDFIIYLLGYPRMFVSDTYKVRHDEETGYWEVPHLNRYAGEPRATSTYGTKRMNALEIIEHSLNIKTIAIMDETSCMTTASGVKRVLNREETALALEKQRIIGEEFQKWIRESPIRRQQVEEAFRNKFGVMKRRIFDGSFLTFPTMSKNVHLLPYQKNAVARILLSPNTLLAHAVGAGKTFVMIAAGMEMRRTGRAKKLLYVVPNNIVGQWEKVFMEMYPQAKLIVLAPGCFPILRRRSILEQIQKEDCDAVIMAYSTFGMIPLSKAYHRQRLSKELSTLERRARQDDSPFSVMRRRIKRVESELWELGTGEKDMPFIGFDMLGFDRMFVDEAHNFKNVPIDTKIHRVLGISQMGSQKCCDMLDKVRYIQSQNAGGGVVFATATPITNSITDCYIMQQYLQSGMLSLLGIGSFDAWVGNFAERSTNFEVDVDTNGYRLTTRFSRFHNLDELTSMLCTFADFHDLEGEVELPEFKGHTDVVVKKSEELKKFLLDISARADKVRLGVVRRAEDNMLKICTDGRKAALDIRLVDEEAGFDSDSKVAVCARNIASIYFGSEDLTQLVFCDSSTPKAGFNLYDELRRLLVDMGIPKGEIAFVHDAVTEKKRDALFEQMRKGKVRVLIGSTFKLGLGVNVQDRLVCIHHLDVPWKPADMVQREGRMIRRGNLNKEVRIFRYVTEGSFDAYSWQLLETKQAFISALLSGSLSQSEADDVDSAILNYGEIKALAVGNPLLKKRIETANELTRMQTVRRKSLEQKVFLEAEIAETVPLIGRGRRLVGQCEKDIAHYRENKRELSPEERMQMRTLLSSVTFEGKEQVLCTYQGFSLKVPANLPPERPYLLLENEGAYRVELGDTERGNLMRLDNCLEGLPARLEKLQARQREREEHLQALKAELGRIPDYTSVIERLTKQLEQLDKKLQGGTDE